MNYVYILKCADGTLYTGYTNDLERRLAAHNAGTGAKYTRGRGPVELVYHEALSSKEDALKRERQIKQLKRAAKIKILSSSPTLNGLNN